MSRPGKSSKLLYDQGTSFRAGDRELQEAFKALHLTLNTQLAEDQIKFHCNSPSVPHFGGSQKYENRSVKAALTTALCLQVIKEVLVEIEGILSSKPLSYVSSDLAVPNLLNPNLLPACPQGGNQMKALGTVFH